MTRDELATFTKTLKGFFPEATPEQALLVAETAAPMEYARCLAVLKTHKRLHDFFSVKVITESLVSDHRKAEAVGHQSREERVIDWLRNEDPHGTHGESDLEVLEAHFSSGRRAVEASSVPAESIAEARKTLAGHALIALREIGLEDGAQELARQWAGLDAATQPSGEPNP